LATPKGVVVTIEEVLHYRQATFEDGKKEERYALKFVGKRRQLVLNATNRKTLVQIFQTPRTREWLGKQVELYLVDDVRKPGGKRGETCLGIRIRKPTKKEATDHEP
jgi:hypothetical protein